jgi:hypothetical protein
MVVELRLLVLRVSLAAALLLTAAVAAGWKWNRLPLH